MGVKDLQRYADMANGVAHGNTRQSPQSDQVRSGEQFKRPAQNSGTRHVPDVPAVDRFDSKSIHPGNSAPQPPKGNMNGGRAGMKGAQEKIGLRTGNKRAIPGTEMG